MNLAEKISYERRRAGMSQEQLADKLGITRQSVSKWESGAAVPELTKLAAMSDVFQVSIDYLVKDNIEEEIRRHDKSRNSGYDEGYNEAERERTRRLEEKMDALARYMKGYQYTSKTSIHGIPLVSIRFSRNLGKEGVAKGIIAIGNIAVGVISIGALSVGVVSFGAITAGALALGAFALGIFAWGALAVGIMAFGSCAVGVYSAGVAAYGSEVAVGVAAAGKTAVGESVRGTNCLQWHKGISEQEIRDFLVLHHPRLWEPLREMFVTFGLHIR